MTWLKVRFPMGQLHVFIKLDIPDHPTLSHSGAIWVLPPSSAPFLERYVLVRKTERELVIATSLLWVNYFTVLTMYS